MEGELGSKTDPTKARSHTHDSHIVECILAHLAHLDTYTSMLGILAYLAHLHTCTLAYLHTWTWHTCTLAYLHTCTLAHLHTCTLAHLHTCLLVQTCRHAYLHAYILVDLQTCTPVYARRLCSDEQNARARETKTGDWHGTCRTKYACVQVCKCTSRLTHLWRETGKRCA